MITFPGSIKLIEERIQNIENRLGVSEISNSFGEILKEELETETAGKSKINDIIKKVSQKYGVDEKLVNLIADAESDKNASAVSSKGAVGVMQLMPGTAKDLGVSNPYDPEENIEGGVKFLKELIKKYDGNVELALAAYNAGEGNVKKYNGVPPFRETQNYVNKIMKDYIKNQNSALINGEGNGG